MFLELTLYSTEEKMLININRIGTILPDGEGTVILVDGVEYGVKESYEDIVKAINNWDRLTKA